MSPDYSFSLATMLLALRTGVDFLRHPTAAWAKVKARPANARGVLLGYALWWILAVALVGWAAQVVPLVQGFGSSAGHGAMHVGMQVLKSVGSAAMTGLWALLALLAMAAVTLLVGNRGGKPLVQWPDALTLMAYSMTPVWLAWMASVLSGEDSLMLLGIGYGLYGVWTGLHQEVLWQPVAKREGFMVGVGLVAMVVGAFYSGLGAVLMLVTGAVLLVARKADDAAHEVGANRLGAQEDGAHETAVERRPVAQTVSQTVDKPTSAPERPPAIMPVVDASPSPAPHAGNAQTKTLDKKIAAATAQGDMAEVVRLMGEKNLALQGVAAARGKVGES
jgi:hypothetical protein